MNSRPNLETRRQWKKEALELIQQANTASTKASKHQARALLHAKKAGACLIEAKQQVPYKQWNKFVVSRLGIRDSSIEKAS